MSKIAKKVLTYFMDDPFHSLAGMPYTLDVNQQRERPRLGFCSRTMALN